MVHMIEETWSRWAGSAFSRRRAGWGVRRGGGSNRVRRRRPLIDRVCLKYSGLSYADWRRGRNEAPPCQRCGRREVAVRVIRTAGGAEVASGKPVGRDGAAR